MVCIIFAAFRISTYYTSMQEIHSSSCQYMYYKGLCSIGNIIGSFVRPYLPCLSAYWNTFGSCRQNFKGCTLIVGFQPLAHSSILAKHMWQSQQKSTTWVQKITNFFPFLLYHKSLTIYSNTTQFSTAAEFNGDSSAIYKI